METIRKLQRSIANGDCAVLALESLGDLKVMLEGKTEELSSRAENVLVLLQGVDSQLLNYQIAPNILKVVNFNGISKQQLVDETRSRFAEKISSVVNKSKDELFSNPEYVKYYEKLKELGENFSEEEYINLFAKRCLHEAVSSTVAEFLPKNLEQGLLVDELTDIVTNFDVTRDELKDKEKELKAAVGKMSKDSVMSFITEKKEEILNGGLEKFSKSHIERIIDNSELLNEEDKKILQGMPWAEVGKIGKEIAKEGDISFMNQARLAKIMLQSGLYKKLYSLSKDVMSASWDCRSELWDSYMLYRDVNKLADTAVDLGSSTMKLVSSSDQMLDLAKDMGEMFHDVAANISERNFSIGNIAELGDITSTLHSLCREQLEGLKSEHFSLDDFQQLFDDQLKEIFGKGLGEIAEVDFQNIFRELGPRLAEDVKDIFKKEIHEISASDIFEIMGKFNNKEELLATVSEKLEGILSRSMTTLLNDTVGGVLEGHFDVKEVVNNATEIFSKIDGENFTLEQGLELFKEKFKRKIKDSVLSFVEDKVKNISPEGVVDAIQGIVTKSIENSKFFTEEEKEAIRRLPMDDLKKVGKEIIDNDFNVSFKNMVSIGRILTKTLSFGKVLSLAGSLLKFAWKHKSLLWKAYNVYSDANKVLEKANDVKESADTLLESEKIREGAEKLGIEADSVESLVNQGRRVASDISLDDLSKGLDNATSKLEKSVDNMKEYAKEKVKETAVNAGVIIVNKVLREKSDSIVERRRTIIKSKPEEPKHTKTKQKTITWKKL